MDHGLDAFRAMYSTLMHSRRKLNGIWAWHNHFEFRSEDV